MQLKMNLDDVCWRRDGMIQEQKLKKHTISSFVDSEHLALSDEDNGEI